MTRALADNPDKVVETRAEARPDSESFVTGLWKLLRKNCDLEVDEAHPRRTLVATTRHFELSQIVSELNKLKYIICFDGGRTRARTLDPLIKSQLLYQLSYAPIEKRRCRHRRRRGV